MIFKLLLFKYIIFIFRSYCVVETVDRTIPNNFIHTKDLLFSYQIHIYFCGIFSEVLLFYQYKVLS